VFVVLLMLMLMLFVGVAYIYAILEEALCQIKQNDIRNSYRIP